MLIGAVAIAAAVFTSCVVPSSRYAKPWPTRVDKQRAATVAIHMSCLDFGSGRVLMWRGSGVITGRHTILTAAHVADCPSGLYELNIETASGVILEALVAVQADEYDIAKIVTEDLLPWFQFEIGPVPQPGDYVCSESANPSRMLRCGFVTNLEPGRKGADIKHNLTPVQGNSGGGLFDDQGRLVGIITRTYSDGSAGRSASLWEHREVMGASY